MKKAWKWITGGAVLLLVLLAFATAVSLRQRARAVAEASATATRFLSDLNAHDYRGAHALLDASQQRTLTVAAMRAAEERIESRYGRPFGKSAVDEWHPDRRLTRIALSCSNIYRKGIRPIRVVLIQTAGGWRVHEYRYDFSPA